ncbi:MAG: hypothetical protein JWQ07_5053 [Ramlibacter sp.]|nr:hypothetical protein [Ramlibacter sp.]
MAASFRLAGPPIFLGPAGLTERLLSFPEVGVSPDFLSSRPPQTEELICCSGVGYTQENVLIGTFGD